jgi:hypothetical protein
MTLTRIVHRLEGMENVEVSRDIEYHVSDDGPLVMDVYHPRSASAAGGAPVVTIVAGYRDVGVPLVLGCRFREMEMVVSLAQLIAASGMAVVAYSTSDPSGDVFRVLEYLGTNAGRLGIDSGRMGLWAQSGNVPTALTALMSPRLRPPVKAAVLSNGFMLETGTAVSDAARTYGFAAAPAGMSFDDVPTDVPLFIARSGLDQFAGLNESLDAFVANAVKRNLPMTFVNHAGAAHGFELNHDSSTTRLVIDMMLAFMRVHLSA